MHIFKEIIELQNTAEFFKIYYLQLVHSIKSPSMIDYIGNIGVKGIYCDAFKSRGAVLQMRGS